MLSLYPNISIFGYTARKPFSEIGKEIVKLTANSEDLLSKKLLGLICPEQLNKVKNCASCGLCWNNNIDNIIFKTH